MEFNELVATAISTSRRGRNSPPHGPDLHDGAQQRLVSLSLVLRDVEMIPSQLEEPRVRLSRVGEELTGVLEISASSREGFARQYSRRAVSARR